MKKYCKCGCGKKIKEHNIYVSGHNNSKVWQLSKIMQKNKLKDLYINKKLSATKISKLYNVSPGTIILLCKKYGIKTRNKSQSQKTYNNNFPDRKIKQSKFMKNNNPMNNPEYRKKVSQPREKNPMWNGGKDISCEKCGKKRYIKPSAYNKLVLNGICWKCHRHAKHRSSIELMVANELKNRNIEFEEEVSFHGMFLDFLLPNKTVIECDGEYWHSLPENRNRDLKKAQLLKNEGYKLFRLSEKDIKKDVQLCVAEVMLNGK